MVIFQNIWWLLVLIGVMILIHELGHYWAARLFDVKIEAFSFGFGPRLFGFRRGETDFRFSLILFGGYVKMAGEQPGEETNDPRAFTAKPRWQRLIIAFAGPAMNVVLAVALVTGLYMVRYPKMPASERDAIVGHVVPDSPAAKAGIQEGDEIVRVDGIQAPTWEDVFIREISNAGNPISLVLNRDGQQIRATVTPILDERTGVGFAGWSEQSEIQVSGYVPGVDAARNAGLIRGDILLAINGQPIRSSHKLNEVLTASAGKPVEILYSREGVRHKTAVQPEKSSATGEERWMIGVQLEPRVIMTRLSFPEALRESIDRNLKSATLIYKFLQGIVERRMSAKSLEGPIRIAQLSGEAAREGPEAFIGLMAMVSLNLAIFNLLPIPILDGGVILLLLIEMLMRRDLSLQVKETVFKLGFVFLMAVVMFVLYNDISKILPG
ncbi:MAG TPA: RIP metalloprotease RseP [Bryobacteraceae bacterium]|nr:RIP metalloprotease RseP [Bryobacteraceae bacterium]